MVRLAALLFPAKGLTTNEIVEIIARVRFQDVKVLKCAVVLTTIVIRIKVKVTIDLKIVSLSEMTIISFVVFRSFAGVSRGEGFLGVSNEEGLPGVSKEESLPRISKEEGLPGVSNKKGLPGVPK